MFYFLVSGNIIYIFSSILIFCLSFFLRNVLFKVEKRAGFTEAGMFFISFLFLGYLLKLLNIDTNVTSYFPDKILITSGTAFIFIFIISFLSSSNSDKTKFINIVVLAAIFYLTQTNKEIINSFMVNNPKVIDFIIGSPVLYLGLLLSGLKDYLSKNR